MAARPWLDGRPGYTISLTDDLQPPDYSVPGLRPNANVLVGVRSVDGYDGGPERAFAPGSIVVGAAVTLVFAVADEPAPPSA